MELKRKDCLTCIDRTIPALCAKTNNPYTYCPLIFVHEDDMILSIVTMIFQDAKRIEENSIEWAQRIDSATRELTAYMNGRIHEAAKIGQVVDMMDILIDSNNLGG